MLDYIRIHGLRGFQTAQQLNLAKPTGAPGSGLTVVLGANNSGKTTIIEAFRAIRMADPPSFSQGRRNLPAGDTVEIVASCDGGMATLRSLRSGQSETERKTQGDLITLRRLLILPSRRFFEPYFGKATWNRVDYAESAGRLPSSRSTNLNDLTNRLFAVNRDRGAFDELFSKLVSPLPSWTIDQTDEGSYFLKFQDARGTHSSEGLGEGLVSLLYIVDALYDSRDGDLIVIDEPELSLHPALQRRLASIIFEYAASRQIVIATHSPYLIDLRGLESGMAVARTHISHDGVQVSQLSAETARRLYGLLRDKNNPHLLGLNAREIFFIDDRVILVEGQEDVIFYEVVLTELDVQLGGDFFGWGVGGAGNMEHVASVLSELGYSKVVGILDADKVAVVDVLRRRFPDYRFIAQPANDVRSKAERSPRAAVEGLLNNRNDSVRPEHLESIRALFTEVNQYLADAPI